MMATGSVERRKPKVLGSCGLARKRPRPCRAVCLAVCALIFFCTLLPGGGQAFARTADSEELSLERAQTLAEWRNPAVELAELSRDAAVVAARTAGPADVIKRRIEVYKAEKSLEGTKENLKLQVTMAYYGCVLADRSLEVSRQARARAKEYLEVARRLYGEGLAAKKDVLDAERGLADAEAGVLKAEEASERAWSNLLTTVGLELDLRPTLTTPLEYSPGPPVNLEEATEKALEKRAEIRIAEYDVDLAETSEELAQGTPGEEAAAIAADMARVILGMQKDLVRAQVRQAFATLNAASERVAATVKAVAAAEEALRIVNLRYREGMATALEVAMADLALQQAQLAHLQAVYDHEIAKAAFDCATGEGFYPRPPASGMSGASLSGAPSGDT